MQSDDDINTEVNKRVQCGGNNWRRHMRQESTTTGEGKYPLDDRSASYAVRDGDSTND